MIFLKKIFQPFLRLFHRFFIIKVSVFFYAFFLIYFSVLSPYDRHFFSILTNTFQYTFFTSLIIGGVVFFYRSIKRYPLATGILILGGINAFIILNYSFVYGLLDYFKDAYSEGYVDAQKSIINFVDSHLKNKGKIFIMDLDEFEYIKAIKMNGVNTFEVVKI